jgi:flagellar hook-associated protein FlgK
MAAAGDTLKSSELGGQIGGLINARDDVLGQSGKQPGSLAYDFATTVNAQHEAGYALDGSKGNDLFATLATSSRGLRPRWPWIRRCMPIHR